jgi:hypothetical protein
LFDGVDKRLTIFIKNNEPVEKTYNTKYYRWVSEERDSLFANLTYQQIEKDIFGIKGYPKISFAIEKSVLKSLKQKTKAVSNFLLSTSSHKVKYTRKLQYFIQFFDSPPKIFDAKRSIIEPTELKSISLDSELDKFIVMSALNSSLFFWFFITFSDCRNVNSREILKFPIEAENINDIAGKSLKKLAIRLNKDLSDNSIMLTRNDKRAGLLEIQSFQPRESKPIIDEIDTILAEHYGFTEEELDFIINYDIKYRMGKELDNEE